MSTVFRVVKNCNYTTLSNHHFKDKRLSWKAKGLLSTMLSLPEDWNYTIEGLAALADDGIKSTNSGLAELEKYGYLVRTQLRGVNGQFGMTEYAIYEQPVEPQNQENDSLREQVEPSTDQASQPLCQNGQTEENTAFPPLCQKRQTEKRISEKGVQLNTNILSTKELNTYNSSSSLDNLQEKLRMDDEEEDERRLRKHLEVDRIARRCSTNLVEMVFKELCKREPAFIFSMTPRALEEVCIAILEKQHKEPIRMLPNLINTYLDNIMIGIKVSGNNKGQIPQRASPDNRFNNFPQNNYDFDELEKELLGN